MGFVEAVVILLNILFAVGLVVIVPIGWAAWADPSRGADERIAGAREALEHGQSEQAGRLLEQALSLKANGRYNARQARTTRDALALLATLRPDGADALLAIHDALPEGGGEVDPALVRAVQEVVPPS